MPEMVKRRLVFSKLGPAAFISHLDLMRTFQRVFIRAGIDIWHTQGFNPHPYIAIALPLPVGHESVCELLDFGLYAGADERDMEARLNAAMPSGIKVYAVYADGRPLKALFYVDNIVRLTFDGGIPAGAAAAVRALFARDAIEVMKKAKGGGEKELDIKPLIGELNVYEDGRELLLDAILQAAGPYLNPAYLVAAIKSYLPNLRFDEARIRRISLLDREMKEFL